MKIFLHFLFLVAIALGFASCGMSKKTLNKDYEKITKKDTLNLDKIRLDKKIKLNKKVRECLDLTSSKRLSEVLTDLSFIEKREFKLKYSSKDIEIPILSNQVCVSNIDDLDKVVKSLTIYKLIIDENEWNKALPKVISVDFQEPAFDKKIKVALKNGNKDVADALSDIGDKIGYTISYRQSDNVQVGTELKDNNLSTNSSNSLYYFKGKYISFKDSTIEEMLESISDSFDVYYDIYPDKKRIIFSKYKTKHLKLTMLDTVIQTTIKASPVADEDSQGSVSQGGTEIDIKLYDSAEDSIKKILGTSTSGNMIDYVDIMQDGTVVVKTTKEKMKHVENTIASFNKSFSQDIELTIDIYNVLINNDMNLGIDIEWINDTINLATSNLASQIATLTKKTGASGSSTTKKLIVDSLNEYGKFLNITSLYFPLKNHIPKTRAKLQKQEYFKKTAFIQTGETNADGEPLYKSDPTVDEAKSGVEGMARASATGDSINMEISLALSNLISLTTIKQGEDTVTVKDAEEDTFDYKNTLLDGETKVADAYYFKADAKKYQGIIPMEDFIIGGESDNSFVRKALVFVVTAKKVRR